jgi:hypothetical protein
MDTPNGALLGKKNRKNLDLSYRHICLGHPLKLKGVWGYFILDDFIIVTPTWRNQYDLMHKTIPKSPRAMLLDLENIKKMQVEKYNKKAKASKAKAATALAELRVPRKWVNVGGSDRGAPKKGRTANLQITAQISFSAQISGHEQIFVQISGHAVKTSHI